MEGSMEPQDQQSPDVLHQDIDQTGPVPDELSDSLSLKHLILATPILGAVAAFAEHMTYEETPFHNQPGSRAAVAEWFRLPVFESQGPRFDSRSLPNGR